MFRPRIIRYKKRTGHGSCSKAVASMNFSPVNSAVRVPSLQVGSLGFESLIGDYIHRHNDWFVCHSDKVETEGSTPSLWTKEILTAILNSTFKEKKRISLMPL